eukprot:6762965-Pyramimonas_sp.AAC.1
MIVVKRRKRNMGIRSRGHGGMYFEHIDGDFKHVGRMSIETHLRGFLGSPTPHGVKLRKIDLFSLASANCRHLSAMRYSNIVHIYSTASAGCDVHERMDVADNETRSHDSKYDSLQVDIASIKP